MTPVTSWDRDERQMTALLGLGGMHGMPPSEVEHTPEAKSSGHVAQKGGELAVGLEKLPSTGTGLVKRSLPIQER
jgi:hypothetical protein